MNEFKRVISATTVALFISAATLNGQNSTSTSEVEALGSPTQSASIASFQERLKLTTDSVKLEVAEIEVAEIEVAEIEVAEINPAEMDSLAMPEVKLGSVEFHEDSSALSAIATYEAQRKVVQMDGYRVGVYFNNSAQARSGAMEVVRRCDSLLSDIPSTMSYDNPYFKVSVGYCTTEEEAVIMLNRVQRHFPKAYLMRERISVENIIASRAQEIKSQEVKIEE